MEFVRVHPGFVRSVPLVLRTPVFFREAVHVNPQAETFLSEKIKDEMARVSKLFDAALQMVCRKPGRLHLVPPVFRTLEFYRKAVEANPEIRAHLPSDIQAALTVPVTTTTHTDS